MLDGEIFMHTKIFTKDKTEDINIGIICNNLDVSESDYSYEFTVKSTDTHLIDIISYDFIRNGNISLMVCTSAPFSCNSFL